LIGLTMTCGRVFGLLLPVLAILIVATTNICAEERRGSIASDCGSGAATAVTVAAIADALTLVLTDGREVRLAGIEAPVSPNEPLSTVAAAALSALIGGQNVALKYLEPRTDRYGRILAHVFIVRGGVEQSVQQSLIAAGHARVAVRVWGKSCAIGFFATEHAARAAKMGLWGDPFYDIKNAENPAGILAERGRFTLVEGKVASVRESGGVIYINFGRRWSEDFTVTILKRDERKFLSAGVVPRTLSGRRIRVRGYIEERGGPWIEAIAPEQIEIAEGE